MVDAETKHQLVIDQLEGEHEEAMEKQVTRERQAVETNIQLRQEIEQMKVGLSLQILFFFFL